MRATINKLTDMNTEQNDVPLSWKEQRKQQWKLLYANKKLLRNFLVISGVIITSGLLLTVGYFVSSKAHQANSLQNKRSELIIRDLNEINAEIQEISRNPKNSQQQAALQMIEQDLVGLQHVAIETAKSSDIQKVSSQISSIKEDVDMQMNDLKQAVSENLGHKDYLEATALPFHVISVDVIAGQPYVSVNYANHVSPLAVSDLLSGWRLITADYDSGSAEFENEKKQYVKVNLQG
ncbi:MAG: hypothetical protein ABI597_12455 [Gammaproteobacteria bacterium]